VLALGDPAYPSGGAAPADTARGPLGSRSRWALAGGKLPRLPFSGWEAQWVAKAFNDAGVKAATLTGRTATEAGVRYWSPGRRVLHLACHGLADRELGNFFGALALAPGRKADDPADDGFLTLPEIHALDLKSCELAVLSACETNLGPQQKGEGTWALSRGFLVAGARRVVASNWLVDDEAAASLVSVFCTGQAKAEKGGGRADYARSLQQAKRWVRQQEKWKAPYYWASLVLIGPP
jgi:CHAT domain-containing protein